MPAPSADHPLQRRFREQLIALGIAAPDVHLLAALSGGCDSVVLLHLLRFGTGERSPQLSAAHFDHGMRPESEGDAEWVAGLCESWKVELVRGRTLERLASENHARHARYHFLRGAARSVGATWVVTAHHADDQAETVLFRILRGTGLRGLGGIPAVSSSLLRPLLPFWREELEQYACEVGLRWREDASNRSLKPTRNRIRQEVLPWIEQTIAPGARRHLVELAELAQESEQEGEAAVARALAGAVTREENSILVEREPFRSSAPGLASRLLRFLLVPYEIVLDRVGTRMAVQFITEAPSGRTMQLPGGVRLGTEWNRVRIFRNQQPPPDRLLTIPAVPAGTEEGQIRIGGRRWHVRWSAGGCRDQRPLPDSNAATVALRLEALHFPLLLRRWQPGDRIRTSLGEKKLKKVWVEHRIPRFLRFQLPVLADATGAILWVPEVVSAPAHSAARGEEALFIAVADA